MLSRMAAPKKSGPASCPSSKTIWILVTVPVTAHEPLGVPQLDEKPISGTLLPQRSLIHPCPGTSVVGGGELQPMKNEPTVVSTSNRGAPAPQCDPNGPA